MTTLIGESQVVSSGTFLQNTTYKIRSTGKYFLVFCCTSSLPGDMIVSYQICKNKAPIKGAFSQCASAQNDKQPFVFSTNISIVSRLLINDVLSIKAKVISGIKSDSIEIVNTIFNIIKL